MSEAVLIVAVGAAILFNNGETHKNSVDFQNSIIAKSVFNAYSTCNSDVSVEQYLSVECGGVSGKPFAENAGCTACLIAQSQWQINAHDFETEFAVENPSYDPVYITSLPESTQNLLITGKTTDENVSFGGVCQMPCNNCITGNIHQSSTITFTESCSDTETFQNSLQVQLKANISSIMKNKEDVFGQLSSMFDSNTEDISNSYSNYVSNLFVVNLKDIVESNMKVAQNITIGTPGDKINSVYINNVSQTTHSQGILNSISNNKFVNSLVSQQDIDETLKEYHKNDTTGDICDDITKTVDSLGRLFTSIIGKVIIIIIVVLVGVILTMIALAAFAPKKAKDLLNLSMK
jgi:hypothetical protein